MASSLGAVRREDRRCCPSVCAGPAVSWPPACGAAPGWLLAGHSPQCTGSSSRAAPGSDLWPWGPGTFLGMTSKAAAWGTHGLGALALGGQRCSPEGVMQPKACQRGRHTRATGFLGEVCPGGSESGDGRPGQHLECLLGARLRAEPRRSRLTLQQPVKPRSSHCRIRN